jgi:hypothetical protein
MEDNYTKMNHSGMSDDIREFGKAFIVARKAFSTAKKESKNAFGGYNYADIDAIYFAVQDSLNAQDIWIVHMRKFINDLELLKIITEREVLYTRLVHAPSGQYVEDCCYLSSEKAGNQAKGSANTYMKKYAVLNLCGISTKDMDDDCAAEQKHIEENDNSGTITKAQFEELVAAMNTGKNAKWLRDAICKSNNLKKLGDMKASSFSGALTFAKKNAK